MYNPGLYIRAGSRRSSPASLPGFAGYFHCFTSLNMPRRWTHNRLLFTKLQLLKNVKKTLITRSNWNCWNFYSLGTNSCCNVFLSKACHKWWGFNCHFIFWKHYQERKKWYFFLFFLLKLHLSMPYRNGCFILINQQ